MSLELNSRHRAMLQEMGVTVWLPATEPGVDEDIQTAIKSIANKAINTPASAEKQALNAVVPRAADAMQAGLSSGPVAVSAKAATASQALLLTPLPAGLESMDWASLKQAAAACQACHLGRGRKNSVFGTLPHAFEHAPDQADWLIVGDPPVESDDVLGAPFTGEAGQLLANMLKAMGIDQASQVVLTPATKCRTEGQSTGPHELAQCEAYLRRQVALVRPKMILAMGRYAAQALLAQSVADLHTVPLGKLRGTVHRYQGIPVVVTYSPAALLRNAPDKAKAWADLCLALATLHTSA